MDFKSLVSADSTTAAYCSFILSYYKMFVKSSFRNFKINFKKGLTNEMKCAIMILLHRWPVGQAVKTPPFHGGIMGSIPVRVTFHASQKCRYIDISGFSFSLKIHFDHYLIIILEKRSFGAFGYAPFASFSSSFFLMVKSSAALTASETLALDSSNMWQ